MGCVLAVDAGTTGIRALAVDETGQVLDLAYRELTQHFPRPGWVEHYADDIWRHVRDTLAEVAGRRRDAGDTVATIGIANQRETVVAWDRSTGRPLHRAIVWQDRRTAARCDELQRAGRLPLVRRRTGLMLDPYFSATKMHWLLGSGNVPDTPDLVLGTVDSWILWHLTGGAGRQGCRPAGTGMVVTDATNASRTLLYDIGERRWSAELCDTFGVPRRALPEIRPSCGRLGVVGGELANVPGLSGVPVSGVAGDQQAALFGQACFEPGMVKATYGTGSFVLLNVGDRCPEPAGGLLATVAWDLGEHGATPDGGTGHQVTYALEGAVLATGAAVQCLRDGLGIIDQAADVGPLAASVPGSAGAVFVPAFAGMGSPRWDPYARGAVVGLSRGVGRAHLARAVVEAMAFQVRDVVDVMSAVAGRRAGVLRVDGGASAMDLLLQLQADQLQLAVSRPTTTETTALGAATLAGLAEGVWGSTGELADLWTLDVECTPSVPASVADIAHEQWAGAVERALRWAGSPAPGDPVAGAGRRAASRPWPGD